MNRNNAALILPAIGLLGCCFAACLAIFRPEYLTNRYLGTLIFLQLMLFAVWKFRERFFLLLIVVFLWAGTALPLQEVWTSGRWAVLATAAVVGFAVFIKDKNCRFGLIHLLALSCILGAVVSAMSSAYPRQALFKAISLTLLFLYASSGARLAVGNKPEQFLSRLVFFCELLTYFTAVAYLIFRFQVFGSSNSLGAVMGVAVVPLLLWGILTADAGQLIRQRRICAFLMALFLLLYSVARAGIVAGPLSCLLVCVALRRYKLVVNGLVVAIMLATLAATVTSYQAEPSDSVASLFLYKGHREGGILGSRRTPWDETVAVIREHPWFGSGFGTSINVVNGAGTRSKYATAPQAGREHGNSYLAITEWMGLLGVLPFCALLVVIAISIVRVLSGLRRTGNIHNVAVPIAMVLAAGLVHAIFEDWLFAPGYYLCVFFWALAFSLVDFLPQHLPSHVRIRQAPPNLAAQYATFAAHR